MAQGGRTIVLGWLTGNKLHEEGNLPRAHSWVGKACTGAWRPGLEGSTCPWGQPLGHSTLTLSDCEGLCVGEINGEEGFPEEVGDQGGP